MPQTTGDRLMVGEPAMTQIETAKPSDARTAIEICGLHKRFGKHEVLRGIDLTVHKGEVVSILGKSGGGKSTLLRCINLLDTPTAGEITLAGERVYDSERGPVRGRQLVALRRRAGMLFQALNVFPTMTVVENVAVPLMRTRGAKGEVAVKTALALLDRVGIA